MYIGTEKHIFLKTLYKYIKFSYRAINYCHRKNNSRKKHFIPLQFFFCISFIKRDNYYIFIKIYILFLRYLFILLQDYCFNNGKQNVHLTGEFLSFN